MSDRDTIHKQTTSLPVVPRYWADDDPLAECQTTDAIESVSTSKENTNDRQN